MNKKKKCVKFLHNLCGEAAEIVQQEQAKSVLSGKYQGRSYVINKIIVEWHQTRTDQASL